MTSDDIYKEGKKKFINYIIGKLSFFFFFLDCCNYNIVGCQDLHHFWLYTLVPHQADLSSLGSQARKVLLRRGGIVPHRLSNPPTHALYALRACMSVPLLHPFNVGCQDLHHFWLYTLVPHQTDLSSLGNQALMVLS